MNYYYDVILNWNEENVYSFYEWNDTDSLELIKKIPLIKINHQTFLDFISYKIQVSPSLLDFIYNKTLVSEKKGLEKILYASLFTDGKNIIAIEFNEQGLSTNYSMLLLDDELNILESLKTIKEIEIKYQKISKLLINHEIRQISDAKKVITLEINYLYKYKDLSKLRYLYYEYKKERIEDVEQIYNVFLNDLTKTFNEDILRIFDIIKLSYHNV